MIECNVFQIKLELCSEGARRVLVYELSSDLPCGTEVILTVFRQYKDQRGGICEWVLDDAKHALVATGQGDYNGFSGRLDIDEGDRVALKEFNSLIDSFSSTINGPVESLLHVSAIVGGRQRLKAFGSKNGNLSGALVKNAGGINVVSQDEVVDIPMNEQYDPRT